MEGITLYVLENYGPNALVFAALGAIAVTIWRDKRKATPQPPAKVSAADVVEKITQASDAANQMHELHTSTARIEADVAKIHVALIEIRTMMEARK